MDEPGALAVGNRVLGFTIEYFLELYRRRVVIACEQHFHSRRVGDLAAQANRGATQRKQAPAHLGDAERGSLARDADVSAL